MSIVALAPPDQKARYARKENMNIVKDLQDDKYDRVEHLKVVVIKHTCKLNMM